LKLLVFHTMHAHLAACLSVDLLTKSAFHLVEHDFSGSLIFLFFFLKKTNQKNYQVTSFKPYSNISFNMTQSQQFQVVVLDSRYELMNAWH
jgi:hypothetical protein